MRSSNRRTRFGRRHQIRTEALEVRALLSAISGNVFSDLNRNGAAEANEGPVANAGVYIDANNNGGKDDGEVSAVTDSDGNYRFDSLSDGDYVVRQVVAGTLQQTTPGTIYGTGYDTPPDGSVRMTYLFEMDPTTGEIQLIGEKHPERVGEIIITNSGDVFGVQAISDRFYSIDLSTGAQTLIGTSDHNIGGAMTYDPLTDTIYAFARTADDLTQLAIIDPATGNATPIGSGVEPFIHSGMTFDPVERVIYAFDNGGTISTDGFYKFELDGTGERIADTQEPINAWAFELVGDEFLLMELGGDNQQILSVNPETGTWTDAFTTDRFLAMESMVYTGQFLEGHKLTIANGVSVDNVDFGVIETTPGFTIEPNATSVEVSEAGTEKTLSVTLDVQPVSDVVITIESSDTTEATASKSELVFTTENWSAAQTVTITGIDDDDDDGDKQSNVIFAIDDSRSADNFDNVAGKTITVTTTDDDDGGGGGVAGVTITESNNSTVVVEAGQGDSLKFVLDTAPTSNVTIDFELSDDPNAQLNTNSLTFTPQNWADTQTVDVTAIDDEVVDGVEQTQLTVSISSDDGDFDALENREFTIKTNDNENAGFLVNLTDGWTEVEEKGTQDHFKIELTAKPQTDVVIVVSGIDATEFSASAEEFVFTPENWNQAQTLTLTGVDDLIDDDDVILNLSFAIEVERSNDFFDTLSSQLRSVKTIDDDSAGFEIIETDEETEVDENESSVDEIRVILTAQPESTVVIDVLVDDSSEIRTNKQQLFFSPENWNAYQVVSVYGVSDNEIDGDASSTVRFSVNADSDDVFKGLDAKSVGVATIDDDEAGYTISHNTFELEEGDKSEFTISIPAAPESPVVFTISAADENQVTTTAEVVFTKLNWELEQKVTIEGIDDDFADGTQSTNVVVAIDAERSDTEFRNLTGSTITVEVADNETAGFEISETDGVTQVDELGLTDSFNVVLSAQPIGNVTFKVAPKSTTEFGIDLEQLTFTSSNWNIPQTIVVTGSPDAIQDGDQTTDITLFVVTETSDVSFHGVSDSISVSTIDTDMPSLDPDADGEKSALGDGLLILRRLAGFSDDALIDGVLGTNARRTDADAIESFVDAMKEGSLDPDGDGFSHALTDGAIVLRYLADFRGESLIKAVVSGDGIRKTPEAITAYLDNAFGNAARGPLPIFHPAKETNPDGFVGPVRQLTFSHDLTTQALFNSELNSNETETGNQNTISAGAGNVDYDDIDTLFAAPIDSLLDDEPFAHWL